MSAIFRAGFLGGAAAGVLDLTGAMLTAWPRGVGPVRVAQSVASGVLGADAFQLGASSAVLGVLLHFVIATGAALTYAQTAGRVPWLVERPWLGGPLYGVAVFWFMRLAVLPLSRVPFTPSPALDVIATGLVVHVVCVGLPIALVLRRALRATGPLPSR